MTPERLSELLMYDASTGVVKVKRTGRVISCDDNGLFILYDGSNKKSIKLKLDRVAYILGNAKLIPDGYLVLHKNMQPNDNRLVNLTLVKRELYKSIKEAYRNINGGCKISLHPCDQFSYIVSWYERGIERQKVVSDTVIAQRELKKLRLKYSKILTKYCIFN